MTRRSVSYALIGGMDEISQPLAIDAGKALACLNHECVDSGYARSDGYERFDGRTSPTDFPFSILQFENGATAMSDGDVVTGATSGATGTLLLDAELTSGAWDGTGEGKVGLRDVTGTFQVGEDLQVSAVTRAVVSSVAYAGAIFSGDDFEDSAADAALIHARALIGAIPGSGNVRGVWQFGGNVYAWRDNVGATACDVYKATSSGWSVLNLGKTVTFNSGGTTEIAAGDTITGATSGATATVEHVVLTTGAWGSGTAEGRFTLSGVTGSFTTENINVGASTNLATLTVAPSDVTLPAGGRYFFVTHNFYGASGGERVYGVNGVGTAFEFDGAVLVHIPTGADTDTPTRVAAFQNHLFLSLPDGGWQNSAIGNPHNWQSINGAATGGVGSEIADFIETTDALIMLAAKGVFALTGTSSENWTLATITHEAGGLPYTGQRIGTAIYLDNRGLRSISTTQAYGNFAMGLISEAVKHTMRTKAENGILPVASTIVRTKNQYRLFYDDGTGFSFYLGRKRPEAMYFELGKTLTCVASTETPDGTERIFFGDNEGYVFELDKGISYDGDAIEGFVQLAYANMGSPDVLKRVFKVGLEATANGEAVIGLAIEFDYSNNEQIATSQRTLQARGAGGLWGIANWGEFFWSSPTENVLEADVEGQGRNASPIIYSNSARNARYTLRGATLHYAERGRVR